MKYLKKKKRSPLPWILAVLTVILVGLILVLALLPGGDEKVPSGETTVPTEEIQPGEATVPTGETGTEEEPSRPAQDTTDPEDAPLPNDQTKEDLRIETPYGTLVYPGEWAGLLQVDHVSGESYKVIFTAKLDSGIKQELFTISFGGSKDGALGTVKVSGKEVSVHVTAVEIKPGANWTDNDISAVFSMQEALNQVLSGLNLQTPQPDETQPPVLPPEDDDEMAIDTPCGELYYPSRWKDYLSLKTDDTDVYSVSFYCKLDGFQDQLLFIIYFGGDTGYEVGTVTDASGNEVTVRMHIEEIEPDINWTDAQRTLVFAMQEDLNYLLSKLS